MTLNLTDADFVKDINCTVGYPDPNCEEKLTTTPLFVNTDTDNNVTSSPGFCVDDADPWKSRRNTLMSVVPVMLLIAGVIGNTMAYMTMNQRVSRRSVIAGALRYLAVIDTVVLFVCEVEILIRGPFGYDILSTNFHLCLSYYYLLNILISLDAYMIVFITAIRLMHMRYPFKVATLCTKFNYYSLLAFVHVMVIALQLGIMASCYMTVSDYTMTDICYMVATKTAAKANPYNVNVIYVFTYILPVTLLLIIGFIGGLSGSKLQRTPIVYRKSYFVAAPGTLKGSFRASNWNISPGSLNKGQVVAGNVSSNAISERDYPDCIVAMLTKPKTDAKDAHTFCSKDQSINTNENAVQTQRGSSANKGVAPDQNIDSTQPTRKGKDLDGRGSGGPKASFSSKKSFSTNMTNLEEEADTDVDVAENGSTGRTEHNHVDQKPESVEDKEDDYAAELKRETAASHRSNQFDSLTRLLMISSFVYLITTVPFIITKFSLHGIIMENVKSYCLRETIVYATFLWQNCNFCANFYCYVASGAQFRAELYALFRGWGCCP